jgi:hypothetical protein
VIKMPFLLLGLFCLFLSLLIGAGSAGALSALVPQKSPGLGLAALSFFTTLLCYSYVILAFEAFHLGAISGRLQALTALVGSILGLLFGIYLIVKALSLLSIMLALFLAVPFGTAVYLATWGMFDTGASRTILSLFMMVQLIGVVFLVIAAPSILKNGKLVLLTAAALAFAFILGLLHGLVPNPFVSIVDTLAALIIGIVATIWMLPLLIGGIFSLARIIRAAA